MQKRQIVIGIDPGKSGGIVMFYNGRISSIAVMPSQLADLIEHFLSLGFPAQMDNTLIHIFIEKVHSMPTDGSKAAFTFGQGLGHLEGVLASLGFYEAYTGIFPAIGKLTYVGPKEWQKFYNLKKDKEESKYNYKKRMVDLARSLHPNAKKEITLKTADAVLIARYGMNSIKE